MKINFKGFQKLKEKRNQLLNSLREDEGGDFLARGAKLLDDYFIENTDIINTSLDPKHASTPFSIIALGGYGRKEQCAFSDVELQILFDKTPPENAGNIFDNLITPLWDIGVYAQYTFRDIHEGIFISDMEKDADVLASLLDSRHVCADKSLYEDFRNLFSNHVVQPRKDEFVDWLIESSRLRHIQYGDSTYLLEPNLKMGQGGLRDYHTMLWIGKILSGITEPRGLEYNGFVSYDEFQELMEAVYFIWYVRNHLQLLMERKYDRLLFQYQEKLAEKLKYKEKNGQQPVERFLGHLHGQMEFIKQQLLKFLYELKGEAISENNKKGEHETDVNGLEIRRGMLTFQSPRMINEYPHLLMSIFEQSARLKIPLSPEATRLVRHFLHKVDEVYRTAPSVIRSFERILVTRAQEFNVLTEMLNTGFLARFIPEFSSVVDRIQYDDYHLYPVDRHMLKTVQTLKSFGSFLDVTNDPFYKELYDQLQDPRLLLWSALLHDIGKALPGGNHSEKGADIIKDILDSKGYSKEEAETGAFLVREHLFLAKTASRRDVDDEDTAIFCAKRIKNNETLKQLYLLTVADSISTGPKAWNTWSAHLMKTLYINISNILEKGDLSAKDAIRNMEMKRKSVLKKDSDPEKRKQRETVFNQFPPRYLLDTSTDDIVKHLTLYENLPEKRNLEWTVEPTTDPDTRKITICARDRHGLLSRISGVFALNNIDIRHFLVYTWRNEIALDIFQVSAPVDRIYENEKWEFIKKDLEAALSETLDLHVHLKTKIDSFQNATPFRKKKPNRVKIDNETSRFSTIIEVFSADFTGLLYVITDALFRCNLDVSAAKVSDTVDEVVSVFYVRDFDDQKVYSPQTISEIETTILKALERF